MRSREVVSPLVCLGLRLADYAVAIVIVIAVAGSRFGVVDLFFFFQAEDGIRDLTVTGVQTCALPIFALGSHRGGHEAAAQGLSQGPIGHLHAALPPGQDGLGPGEGLRVAEALLDEADRKSVV